MSSQPEDSIPPEAQESDVRPQEDSFHGPDGQSFGKIKGIKNEGTTTIAQFVEDNTGDFAGVPPSLLHVIQAVSVNEGKLEAINTWDSAFLSCGVFQWTVGAGTDVGELAGLLDRLQRASPELFQRYFGTYGLGVEINATAQGEPPKGYLLLHGDRLNTPPKKGELRMPIWAYRFWRAAHDRGVRLIQVMHAISRVDVFYAIPQAALFGRPICDFVKSEYGVALLLDEHVNRPAHVPGTLAEAIKAFMAQPGKTDTTAWTTDDEEALLALYIQCRAKTDMTDSQKRAETLKADQRLSKERKSFVA